MYKQEKKAGAHQYVLCIFAGIVLWIVCDIIGIILDNAFFADVIFLLSACVFVYCVYVHYCAVFVYEIDKNAFIVTRKIGRREVTEKIKLSKIDSLCFKKGVISQQTEFKNFCVGVISRKKRCYLLYDKNKKCIVFEPDENLLKLLKEKTDD